MFDPNTLPVHYRADDGSLIEAPTYHLIAQTFLGLPGGPPALWEEGDEITTDIIPNYAMRPINRAAAIRFNEWEESLPPEASAASPEDLMEAARSISQENAGQAPLSAFIWNKMVYERAVEMRAMREGRRLPTSPARTLAPANTTGVPLMTNADIKDLAHRGGDTGVKSHRGPAAARRVKPGAPPAAPLLTNEPRSPVGDAVGV